MGSNTEKTGNNALQMPSLETLIDVIDQQAGLVPHPYASEGGAASTDKENEEQKKKQRQYLRFSLNETTFALPLKNALQIDYLPEITPLPNLPRWVRGICNLHGQIYSVVELKPVFRLAQENANPIRKLILIKSKDIQIAVLVDGISGILNIDMKKQKKKAPMSLHPSCGPFIRNVVDTGRQTIHLLNVDELMAALAV
jgi:purine-binding chemotaxis protein CheW